MDKNYRFLILFSFGGYYLIQLLTKSIGPPFSIVRNFWISMHFNIDSSFDIAAARISLVNTVFYIAVVSFFLFTIKRIRDNGNVNALKTVLYVTLSSIVFLVIDLAITYIASVILTTGALNLYDWFINILIVLSSILYLISLVAIANEGKFTWGSFKRTLNIRGYSVILLVAVALRALLQAAPYISQQLVQTEYWVSIVLPLLTALVFTLLIKPVLRMEN